MATKADGFLIGWRTLPNELKLELLRNALPSEHYISANTMRGEREAEDHVSLSRHILPILACPEIASLGINILYEQNIVFFLLLGTTEQPLLLPPKHLRKHVRSWYAALHIEKLEDHSFKYLARNLTGFPTLKRIHLDIWGTAGSPGSFASGHRSVAHLDATRKRLVVMPKYKFGTQELEVVYRPHDPKAILVDDFDEILLGKLTTVDQYEGTMQTCKRQMFFLGGAQKVVDKWPAILDAGAYSRRTKIRVWR